MAQKKDTDQTNLLNALESIKGLLEQSESKLNAARESISLANQARDSSKASMQSRKADEPMVPVLDDIIEPEILELPFEEIARKISDIEEEVPVLTDNTMDSDTMLLHLDQLQKDLEKHVRDTLMRTVVSIEKEVKKTIQAQLDKLREQIRDQD